MLLFDGSLWWVSCATLPPFHRQLQPQQSQPEDRERRISYYSCCCCRFCSWERSWNRRIAAFLLVGRLCVLRCATVNCLLLSLCLCLVVGYWLICRLSSWGSKIIVPRRACLAPGKNQDFASRPLYFVILGHNILKKTTSRQSNFYRPNNFRQSACYCTNFSRQIWKCERTTSPKRNKVKREQE